MVCPGDTCVGKEFPSQFPKAALHAVADDGVADFFGDGVAYTHLSVSILPIMDKQNKAAKGSPLSGIGGQKI